MQIALPAHVLDAALGAARVVAAADGDFDDNERRLIAAAAHALGYEGDIERVRAVSPADLAATTDDPTTRGRVVQALILVALMDGEVKDAEHDAIRAYADAL